jgi:hypothetical protein
MWFMSDGTHLHAIGKSLDKSSGQIDSIYSMDKQRIMKFKKGNMVPEVTTFRPFVRPVAKVSTYTGVDSGSALRVATQRWQNNLLKANGMTTGAGTDSTEPTSTRAMVNGHRRPVPENHIKLLEQWFDLDGDDVLQFETETWIELKDKQCMVTGKFSHPKWGDSEWPMTLYNVPLVIVNAYCDYKWAVKAKGVTSASWVEGGYGESLALLGELYSYDWRTVAPEPATHTCEEKVEELVVGPDETLMDKTECMQLIAKGCIQCNGIISWEDRSFATIVNEGRDVLCPGCTDEWKREVV